MPSVERCGRKTARPSPAWGDSGKVPGMAGRRPHRNLDPREEHSLVQHLPNPSHAYPGANVICGHDTHPPVVTRRVDFGL